MESSYAAHRLLYPGITFVIFLVLNFIWGQASSGAVPFGTMFALLCILISFPLCGSRVALLPT